MAHAPRGSGRSQEALGGVAYGPVPLMQAGVRLVEERVRWRAAQACRQPAGREAVGQGALLACMDSIAPPLRLPSSDWLAWRTSASKPAWGSRGVRERGKHRWEDGEEQSRGVDGEWKERRHEEGSAGFLHSWNQLCARHALPDMPCSDEAATRGNSPAGKTPPSSFRTALKCRRWRALFHSSCGTGPSVRTLGR